MSRALRVALATLALGGVSATGCATSSHGEPREISQHGDPVRLRKQLAATMLESHIWNAALQPLNELVAMHKGDADVYVMLGTADRELGLLDEAERQFHRVIELDPKRAEAYSGMAMVRDLRGDPGDQALSDLQKAIELAPRYAAYYNNLGFALYLRGRDKEAIAAYRKGLEQDPSVRRIRNNLGFAYGRMGDLNYAKREFYRGGSKAEAENNLGFVYEQAGDINAACERYQAAAKMAPQAEMIQVNLVRACGASAVPASAPVGPTTKVRKLP